MTLEQIVWDQSKMINFLPTTDRQSFFSIEYASLLYELSGETPVQSYLEAQYAAQHPPYSLEDLRKLKAAGKRVYGIAALQHDARRLCAVHPSGYRTGGESISHPVATQYSPGTIRRWWDD